MDFLEHPLCLFYAGHHETLPNTATPIVMNQDGEEL